MFFLHVLYIKYRCFRENQNDSTRFNPTTKGLRNQNMFFFFSPIGLCGRHTTSLSLEQYLKSHLSV